MGTVQLLHNRIHDENAMLRHILEGTATATGARFFKALVEHLAIAVQTHSAWVTEYIPETRQLHALAFWSNGHVAEDFYLDIDGTACEKVIDTKDIVHYPDNVIRLYPHNATFREFEARSYLGVPLLDDAGRILGNLAVFDTRPMPTEPHLLEIFKIFAGRASAELQRLKADTKVLKSEEKFRRIIATTGEGFVMMDQNLTITDANEAFCRLIGYGMIDILGRSPLDFASDDFRQFLQVNMPRLFSDRHTEFEGTLVSRSGRKIPVRIYGDILTDDQGKTMGYISFISDQTQQKRSLVLAEEVQKSLQPQSSPRVKGYDIAGKTRSCDEIGGDYFDFWVNPQRPQEHVRIVVGDVTGHGAEAALLMTTARAIFRLEASRGYDAAGIINAMNRQLAQDVLDTGRFMTLFCLELDHQNRRLRWVRAGHAPALLYTPQQDRFEELKGEGMALGIETDFSYRVHWASEAVGGQIIAVGTDGIWEAFDRRGRPYGMQAFRDVIRKNAHRQASAIVEAVYEDLHRFTYGVKREDDISLVVVKVEEDEPSSMDWSI
jgi:PAS domain S-box-containing protein